MKILHLCNDYYGTVLYRSMLDSLSEIPGASNTMVVCCLKDENHKIEDDVIPLKILNKWDRISYFFKQRKMEKSIENAISPGEYDIVHGHFLFTNGGIAYRLKKKYGVPYVVTVRNADINLFFKYRKYLIGYANRILREAQAITFLSGAYKNAVINQYVKEKLRDNVAQKSFVIPNGINEIWLENKNVHERRQGDKSINLVYAGAIDENKNLLTTLDACRLLISEGYDISYTVIGKVISEGVHKKIQSEGFVKYLAQKTYSELIDIYKTQDIFVMPSIHESFGLVYAEAMSQGLPVIYSRGQGFDEHFTDGLIGFGVEPKNARDIADHIKLILNDYNEMSIRCMQNAENFDWNISAEKYLLTYK